MDKGIDIIDLWFRYEEIAMHFNNLLMQFRLQLMGGAGVIGTVASYLIGAKVTEPHEHNWLRALVSTGLWVLIAAAASLDLFYYDRLLKGAVAGLLELEAQNPTIQMSTRIEAVVGHGKDTIWYAYGFILSALGLFVGWSWIQHWRLRRTVLAL